MSIDYAIAIERVSSTKQGLMGDSNSDQGAQITRRAEQLSSLLSTKIVIKKTFKLTASASVELNLQPILEALEYCKTSKVKIKYAFIKDIGRGTRGGATIYGQLKSMFARYDIKLIDVYGIISTQSVNTLEHLGIKFDWSEFSPSWTTELLEAERAKGEVRDILTRLIGAEIRYTRLGYPVAQPKYGFASEKIDTEHGKRVTWKPHPHEAQFIIRGFELLMQSNLSDLEIVEHINQLGYKSRKIKIHDPQDKTKIIGYKGEVPLSVKQFQKYIQDPAYAGIHIHKWTDKKAIKAQYNGLVTIDMFNKANKSKKTIIDNEDGTYTIAKGDIPAWRLTKKKENPDYPHKKYVLCPICRANLIGSAPKNKNGHIPRYHCARKHKYWSVNKKIFDKTINDFMQDVEFDDDLKRKFKSIFIEEWDKREQKASNDTVAVNKQLIGIEQEVQMLKEKIKMLTMPETILMFEQDIEKLKQKRAGLMVVREVKENEQLDAETLTNYAKYFMEHLKDLLFEGLNPLKDAAMFGLLFEETPTYQDLENGTPKLACIFKLNRAYHTSKSELVSHQGLEP